MPTTAVAMATTAVAMPTTIRVVQLQWWSKEPEECKITVTWKSVEKSSRGARLSAQISHEGPGHIAAPALRLLFVLIHRSAWKGNSANFVLTEFKEVRPFDGCSYLQCALWCVCRHASRPQRED